eukprot:gene11040-3746_t
MYQQRKTTSHKNSSTLSTVSKAHKRTKGITNKKRKSEITQYMTQPTFKKNDNGNSVFHRTVSNMTKQIENEKETPNKDENRTFSASELMSLFKYDVGNAFNKIFNFFSEEIGNTLKSWISWMKIRCEKSEQIFLEMSKIFVKYLQKLFETVRKNCSDANFQFHESSSMISNVVQSTCFKEFTQKLNEHTFVTAFRAENTVDEILEAYSSSVKKYDKNKRNRFSKVFTEELVKEWRSVSEVKRELEKIIEIELSYVISKSFDL